MYTPRELAEYAAFRSAVAALGRLPLPLAQSAGARIAHALFDLGGKRVGYVLANLRVAYPDLSEAARRAIGRESYVNLAWMLIDVARGAHWTAEDVAARVEVVGIENGHAAMVKGRGAVALSLHQGSFELAMRAMPTVGIPITVIGRPLGNRLLRDEIKRQRESTGSELLAHRNILPELIRVLRKGRAIAALNDQYARRSRGVFVPFLGVRASTSLGPALLAVRTGAPLVPARCIRVGPDRHRLEILPALETPDTGDRRKDAELLTARGNAALEEFIRACPEQWMWSHRRFRHSPDLPGDPYGGR
jgi:KDO2-lipid IV(A) lauroyltransferase